MAESLPTAAEPAQDLGGQERTLIHGSPVGQAALDSSQAPRSRSSSVSSGMSYDEIRDLSGSSYATTLTSVYSWESKYLSPSPADTRFRTSSVRDEPEGGDNAEPSEDPKPNLFHFHSARFTRPLAPSSFPNSHLPHISHRSSGSPAFFTTNAEMTHPGSALHHQWQTSSSHAIPPEFAALQEQHRISLPAAVVLCRNSSLWTFDLPLKYGCIFLGYFNITWMDLSHIDSDSVQCRMRLEWTPGGDSADPTIEPPLTPWWVEPDGSSTNGVDSEIVLHPYSFLPLHILAVSAFSKRDREIGVSEATSVDGWHCQQCGKLNVQRNLRLQRCSDCAVSASYPA
ncbi:hypothetical protein DAEQUDRAFT_269309 [Daedalea quercina L-15889]|uniref:Uncharacterized protein n=1 Tax=Daedalea quercina L-15889 TaxID=1314783 RepID=A0A165QBC9_9APHY|nr:hypothetical protein DAEQUDRAFT_269309 [Daedalea quercina L-15889]